MTFLDAVRLPEFWTRFAWLLMLSGVWLGTAVFVGAVFERLRRRQNALDRIAAEARAHIRRVK